MLSLSNNSRLQNPERKLFLSTQAQMLIEKDSGGRTRPGVPPSPRPFQVLTLSDASRFTPA